MDVVDATLRRWRQSPFIYGQTDCLLAIADHVIDCGGMDVASRFRGTYSDREGAEALLNEYGGHRGLLALLELPEIDPADMGRNCIALIDTGEEEIATLCTGQGVAGRTDGRTVFEIDRKHVTIVAAWRI